jgi:isoquinoline 1-oxidoreductase beta subunit
LLGQKLVGKLVIENNLTVFKDVYAAANCGIVINPDPCANMGEGAIVDGIGNALFGEMMFVDGVPQKNNFHQHRMIRKKEAPEHIEVHFVKNEIDLTGLGEPLFPPIFEAVSNALYKATGRRFYDQPFMPHGELTRAMI